MELFTTFIFALFFFVFGVICTVAVQYWFLSSLLHNSTSEPLSTDDTRDSYQLPTYLKQKIENKSFKENDTGSGLPLNLVLQFLYRELRYSEYVKNWLFKKLTSEFEDLLAKSTIGKLFEYITIKDMNMGSQFPVLKEVLVDNANLDENDHIDLLDVAVYLEYHGEFRLDLCAKMRFGPTAHISIKVEKICGKARLQFTRYPYTHWSFSFYNEPIMDLNVESQFQGRQVQSNVKSLIVNQIKKAIRRKHTLPHYNIRYRPFFAKTDPSQLELDDNNSEITPTGQLNITCMEITRLDFRNGNYQKVYCSFAIDNIPWICVCTKDITKNTCMILEIFLCKYKHGCVGLNVHQEVPNSDYPIVVHRLTAGGCAAKSGLKCGDIILAVNNKPVTSASQISKILRSSHGTVVLRVERIVSDYMLTKAEIDETEFSDVSNSAQDAMVVEGQDAIACDTANLTVTDQRIFARKLSHSSITTGPHSEVNMSSKIAQTIGNFSLRKRRNSVSDISAMGIRSFSPTFGSPSRAQRAPTVISSKAQTENVQPIGVQQKFQKCEIPEIQVESSVRQLKSRTVLKSRDLNVGTCIQVNEEFEFGFEEGDKYLNVNVWGVTTIEQNGAKDVLLGYANIPLNHILYKCRNCSLGHYIRLYSFLPPPNVTSTNSHFQHLQSHTGFEHVFCFGDILLSFEWNPFGENDVKLKAKPPSSGSTHAAPLLDDENINSVVTTTATTTLAKHLLSDRSEHDFIRRQFPTATQCDFCLKRIWMRTAVSCRKCNLHCHKKCVTKCQQTQACNAAKDNKEAIDPIVMDMASATIDISMPNLHNIEQLTSDPDITLHKAESYDDILSSSLTKPDDGSDNDVHSSTSITDAWDAMSAGSSLKRVNSANCLAIPGSNVIHFSAASPQFRQCSSLGQANVCKSLPPSPQHLSPLKKRSLESESIFSSHAIAHSSFQACPEVLEKVWSNFDVSKTNEPTTWIDEEIDVLIENITNNRNEEILMDVAKETGQQFYVHLDQEEKENKINKMVGELKRVLDRTNSEQSLLKKQMSVGILKEVEKTKLLRKKTQLDAKVNAISVLMLHYYSSLQKSTDKLCVRTHGTD